MALSHFYFLHQIHTRQVVYASRTMFGLVFHASKQKLNNNCLLLLCCYLIELSSCVALLSFFCALFIPPNYSRLSRRELNSFAAAKPSEMKTHKTCEKLEQTK